VRLISLALLALADLPATAQPANAQPANAQPAIAQPAHPPAASAVPAAVQPRAIAATLADRLAADFVFPDQGARYAAALRTKADAGAYDGLQGAALATRLTADVQAVAPDGHLRVMYQGQGGGPHIIIKRPDGADAPPPPPGVRPRMIMMRPPQAIEQARWLAPGIAFVRFNLFPGGPDAAQAAQQFMASHADAQTIIFDIRTHRGGGLDEMDVIFPWLFAKPTHLVTMATRTAVDKAGDTPIAGVASLRPGKADADFVNREHWVTPGENPALRDARVFVLTSGMTGSAAEHFALAMKATGRATLVGATTVGANHFGGDQDLGGELSAFVPVGRTFDPATGKDWEGTGITPDIATAPEDALVKALTLSGLPPEKAAALSAEVAPTMPMMRPGGAGQAR
jgi:Peptidase family S41